MERSRIRSGTAALLLLLLLILLAQNGAAVAAVLRERILLCLRTLIPSLYGCTAAAILLRESGALSGISKKCRRTANFLGIPADCFAVFVISQLAGYPVGALLLRDLRQQGKTDESARLGGMCFGCGPAFAVGFAGGALFGDTAAGWMLFGACICANLMLCLLTRPLDRGGNPGTQPAVMQFSAEMLTNAASGTMRSMAQICGMVLLFGVISALCGVLGLTAAAVRLGGLLGVPAQTVRALLDALLDVTQLPAVFRCGLPYRTLLALTGALLSFGGLCVHMQCIAVGGGRCAAGRLLCMRFFAAILTFLLLYAAAPLRQMPETAAVFAPRTAVSATGSVLPALLIICTGFPFLIKKD